MLVRQKTILALLAQFNKPLSRTVFVKLIFLLRHETALERERTFYDFVPYKYGPFSFTLYRELLNLRQDGYINQDEESVALRKRTVQLAREKITELPLVARQAVGMVIGRYGRVNQTDLLKDVYRRYPWYAIKSELTNLKPKLSALPKKARHAVYTAGYEGKSIDAFFNQLLKAGIELIIDVRANPISRRYGFSRRQFSEIAGRIGLVYHHHPGLGIPSEFRTDLSDYESYQRLLAMYEEKMLPECNDEVEEVGALMQKNPAVLVCFEKDVRCCHRSRLAEAVSRNSGLEVVHL